MTLYETSATNASTVTYTGRWAPSSSCSPSQPRSPSPFLFLSLILSLFLSLSLVYPPRKIEAAAPCFAYALNLEP